MPQIDYAKLAEQARREASGPDYAALAEQARQASTPQPSLPPTRSAAGRFASGVGEMVNPVTIAKGLYQTVRHPVDTVSAMYQQQGAEFDKAVQAAREGRYSEMVGHGTASFLPVVGPLAASIGEQAGTGDVAGAAGRLAGGALAWQAPKLVGKIPARIGGTVTPERELAAWGLKQGIPVDVASATANPIPRAAQQLATKTSVAGSVIGTKAAKARQAGLATVGEQLAAKGYTPAVTKETAGAAARAGVEASIKGFDDAADVHYGTVRALEQATPVAVDLVSVKSVLKPALDRLLRKKELTGSLQGAEAHAATALDALVNGPDMAPLSAVDGALSQLKSMSRGAAMPELRSSGQGAAAFAVQKLSKAVDDAAASLGPEAVSALKEGRLATRQKYAAAEVLDALKAEPVRTANAAIAPSDAAVMHLRELQKFAPDSLPHVGKAVLSDLLTEATKDGGFTATQSLATKWQKLGPETKRLLFQDPAYIKDLDRFWALARKMGEQSNPSGSAHVGGLMAQGYLLTDPVTLAAYQLTGAALAKALSSPTITRLLVEGVRVPLKATAVATARYARLTNLIEQATKSGATGTPVPQGNK